MSKAAKFDEFLSSNNINCFSKEEIDNEMHSIVYRAHMEVSSQNLPTMIVLDDSIYTMIRCALPLALSMPATAKAF